MGSELHEAAVLFDLEPDPPELDVQLLPEVLS